MFGTINHGEKFNCNFKIASYWRWRSVNSCEVTTLNNPHNNMTITEYSGVHKPDRNDNAVKAIFNHYWTNHQLRK